MGGVVVASTGVDLNSFTGEDGEVLVVELASGREPDIPPLPPLEERLRADGGGNEGGGICSRSVSSERLVVAVAFVDITDFPAVEEGLERLGDGVAEVIIPTVPVVVVEVVVVGERRLISPVHDGALQPVTDGELKRGGYDGAATIVVSGECVTLSGGEEMSGDLFGGPVAGLSCGRR